MTTATNPNPSPVGIVDANRLTVDEAVSPTPNMRDVIMGWFRPLALTIVRKLTVDFQTREVEVVHETQGVIQPMSIARLKMKTEGERTWKWWTVHANTDLVLQNDDVIIPRGKPRLRIMGNGDWSENGFVVYEAVEDYDYKPGQT
jgi:hypothetical protein